MVYPRFWRVVPHKDTKKLEGGQIRNKYFLGFKSLHFVKKNGARTKTLPDKTSAPNTSDCIAFISCLL